MFPQQPKESVAQSEWIWEGARKEKVVLPDSSIPAQVVSKGQGWEAMVYVLLDTLGKNPNSLAQLTDAAIKQGQYNLVGNLIVVQKLRLLQANQLLKSLEAYLDGKPLQCDYDLLLTFSENLRLNSLQPESITLTVLERILGLGAKIAQVIFFGIFKEMTDRRSLSVIMTQISKTMKDSFDMSFFQNNSIKIFICANNFNFLQNYENYP